MKPVVRHVIPALWRCMCTKRLAESCESSGQALHGYEALTETCEASAVALHVYDAQLHVSPAR